MTKFPDRIAKIQMGETTQYHRPIWAYRVSHGARFPQASELRRSQWVLIPVSARFDLSCPIGAELIRLVRIHLESGLAAATDRRRPAHARIHEARTAAKKARALLCLNRSAEKAFYRRENRRLAKAARSLAAFRDAHVLAITLSSLSRNRRAPLSEAHVRRLHRAFLARQTATKSDPVAQVLRHYGREIRCSLDALGGWNASDDASLLFADFRRAYARCREGHRACLRHPSAAAFHEARKAAKVHYYQCRALRNIWEAGLKRRIKELRVLGDDLGQEHDLSVLRDRLRDLAKDPAHARDHDAIAAGLKGSAMVREAKRREVLARAERLWVEKPRVFVRRFKGWWRLAQAGESARSAAAQ